MLAVVGRHREKRLRHFRFEGVVWDSHRLSWYFSNGSRPPIVRHFVCDNKPCCNPKHLRGGTQTDNLRDAVEKGRMACGDRNGSRTHPERLPRGDQHYSRTNPEKMVRPRGEQHGNAKLKESDIPKIKEQRLSGRTLQSIADEFGVTDGVISRICTGKRWSHTASSTSVAACTSRATNTETGGLAEVEAERETSRAAGLE